jgi:hypothetical protein
MIDSPGWEREINDLKFNCALRGNKGKGSVQHQGVIAWSAKSRTRGDTETNSVGQKMFFHPLLSTNDYSLNKVISLHYSENQFRYNDYFRLHYSQLPCGRREPPRLGTKNK